MGFINSNFLSSKESVKIYRGTPKNKNSSDALTNVARPKVEGAWECFQHVKETTVGECGYHTIAMGNWNGRIDEDIPQSLSLGEFRKEETNENGERLIDLALGQNLKILNTFQNKPRKRRWT